MKIKYSVARLTVIIVAVLCGCGSRLSNQTQNKSEIMNDLKIISHAEWGWQSLIDTLPAHQIQFITLHHEGVDYAPQSEAAVHLRNLQEWCRREKKWIDIPYHYMIDLQGNIYECRPINLPGDTNTGYDVRGHALICLFGNYENIEPSVKQIDVLAALIAHLASKYQVPLENIKGHRDYSETDCPGKNLYAYLQNGELISLIKNKMEVK